MKQPKTINAYMYKLMIEKDMDDFSVIEARDVLVSLADELTDLDEARRLIYRQILSFERKGWLVHHGVGREKRYFKTDEFKQLSFKSRQGKKKTVRAEKEITCLSELVAEQSAYEGELAITLGEMEEYQALMGRFPQQRRVLNPLFDECKERSAKLLGKINAIANVLKVSKQKMDTKC